MKRKSLIAIGILGAIALLASLSMSVYAKELPIVSDHVPGESQLDEVEQEKEALQGFSDNYIEASGIAIEQYRVLTQKYGESPMDPLVPYPKNYGGAYVNKEGSLIIQQVRSVRGEGQKLLETLFGESKTIQSWQTLALELVDFSYADLNEGMKTINTYFQGEPNKEVVTAFSGARVDELINRVVISMLDTSDEAIQRFREKVIDAPFLQFELVQ